MTDSVQTGKPQDKDMTGKYLTFTLDNVEYALEILKVQEIIGMMDITAVPRAPGFVKGVINLRGKVIPVIDLRLKLNLEEKDYNERTCIIVVETIENSELSQIGVVVDSVSEVMHIGGDQIDTVEGLEAEIDQDYILGMAKMESGLKILLDADAALSGSISLSI